MMQPKKWHDKVTSLRAKGKSISEIAREVKLNYYTVRNYFRDTPVEKPASKLPTFTSELLLKELKTRRDLVSLREKYSFTGDQLSSMIESLRAQGYLFNTAEPGFISLQKTVRPFDIKISADWKGEQEIKFGVVSDTHLGSMYQQLSFLHHAYDTFCSRDIKTVYHAGDITDGSGMRRGHEYEVFVHGADAQTEYVVKNYPKCPSIKTYFITGNHDLVHIKNAGHDIGVSIAAKRDDLIYLGPEFARINLTPRIKLDLWHGRDGSSYAHSYALQKYVESIPGGNKPNILFGGHRHKAIWFIERNVHAFEAGCFQAQTPYMRGKRLAAYPGFYIVTVSVAKDSSIAFLGHEFFPLYTPLQKDF